MLVSLNFCLINGEEKVMNIPKIPATISDNLLEFTIDNNYHQINFESRYIIRENDEYEYILNVQNKSCSLEMKKEGYTLDIIVDNASFIKNENKIIIEYLTEANDNKVKIVLEWEEKNDNNRN